MRSEQAPQYFPPGPGPENKAWPENPLAAVTHPDPYPYYASIVAGKPIYRDPVLNLWVVSTAQAVEAVLSSEVCRVRPRGEAVPKAIAASPAGEIFRQLVRTNDGPHHRALKESVSAAFNEQGVSQVKELARRWSERLCESLEAASTSAGLNQFIFQLPVTVMADLLGIPEEMLPATAMWVAELVGSFSPLSTPDQIERASAAARRLLEVVGPTLEHPDAHHSVLAALDPHSVAAGHDSRDAIIANGIGFLTQAYEATAGLIGNTLVALSSNPDAHAQVVSSPILLDSAVAEVIRWDPPVHNTRRYVSAPGYVAGQKMQQDDAILVILAAANRDPAPNPDPHSFDIHRGSRKCYTFGLASHACPGEAYARAIATAAVSRLLSAGFHPGQASRHVTYKPSLNTRIPVFSSFMR